MTIAFDVLTLATSRCRLIARVHGGDLDTISPRRVTFNLATLDATPGLGRRGEEALGPWLTVRADANTVERDGRRIRLSWTEWQLFAFLWDHPRVTFSRVELATGAWGSAVGQPARRGGDLISRIRRKVEHDARYPRVIRAGRVGRPRAPRPGRRRAWSTLSRSRRKSSRWGRDPLPIGQRLPDNAPTDRLLVSIDEAGDIMGVRRSTTNRPVY